MNLIAHNIAIDLYSGTSETIGYLKFVLSISFNV